MDAVDYGPNRVVKISHLVVKTPDPVEIDLYGRGYKLFDRPKIVWVRSIRKYDIRYDS